MFRENRVLKYFEKFTVKYQSRGLFFSKVRKHLLTVASDFSLGVIMKQVNGGTPFFSEFIKL